MSTEQQKQQQQRPWNSPQREQLHGARAAKRSKESQPHSKQQHALASLPAILQPPGGPQRLPKFANEPLQSRIPATARPHAAVEAQPANPYLQALPALTARPYFHGATPRTLPPKGSHNVNSSRPARCPPASPSHAPQRLGGQPQVATQHQQQAIASVILPLDCKTPQKTRFQHGWQPGATNGASTNRGHLYVTPQVNTARQQDQQPLLPHHSSSTFVPQLGSFHNGRNDVMQRAPPQQLPQISSARLHHPTLHVGQDQQQGQHQGPAPGRPALHASQTVASHRRQQRLLPPCSPAFALAQWAAVLSPYEQNEILAFPEIYFVGRVSAGTSANTDQNGDYNSAPGAHISYRYELLRNIGRGSFGQVWECQDHASGRRVALKITRNKQRFQKQAGVEAGILRLLMEHDPDDAAHIVRCFDSFTFRGHACLTFELLGDNLYEHLRACNFQGCSLPMIRRVAQQVLVTLRLLRRLNVIHADIKPENILLAAGTAIKVIDFGSSCFVDRRAYSYLQSRFYRSPEVILGLSYAPPIDIWSLGCVLAELFTGQPLFPGENEKAQLAYIMEVLGKPPQSLLATAPRASHFFDIESGTPLPYLDSRGEWRWPASRTLVQALGGCGDAFFLDFLQRCLCWEAGSRLAPDEALQHPFVTGDTGGVPMQQQVQR